MSILNAIHAYSQSLKLSRVKNFIVVVVGISWSVFVKMLQILNVLLVLYVCQLINQMIIYFIVGIELNTYLPSLAALVSLFSLSLFICVLAIPNTNHIHYQQINNQQVTNCKNGNP